MSFRILGLDPKPFTPLYGLFDAELELGGVRRCRADACPGFPDRIELRDAEPGEHVLLLNYVHQPADTAYRASHAIFVLEGATQAYDRRDEIPEVMRRRTLSLRAFSTDHEIIDADLAEGAAIEACIERLLAKPATAYLHAHYAKYGCYASRIERA